MSIANTPVFTPSSETADQGIPAVPWPFMVVMGLWQLGTLTWAAGLVFGFGLTAVTDPNHELETVVATLVFFAFFADSVLFLLFVLWVSFLMIANSPRFPVAWTIQVLPLAVLLVIWFFVRFVGLLSGLS